jgi:hypothetical protein
MARTMALTASACAVGSKTDDGEKMEQRWDIE